MKKQSKIKFIHLLYTFLLLCSCSSTPISSSSTSSSTSEEITYKEANVIILCGQSNAEGHTWNRMLMEKDRDLFDKYFEANQSRTKIMHRCNAMETQNYNESRDFMSVRLGMGYNFERFGPEIGMTEVFDSQELNRDVFIIKYTSGGTTLQNDWISPSSHPAGSTLYNGMIEYVKKCLTQLEDDHYFPFIKAICWMQGESDGGYFYNQYQKNEANFIKDVRNEFEYYLEEGDGKIKFINGAISRYWENYTIINEAKKKNVEDDALYSAYIDTVAMGLTYDTEPTNGIDYCHYDSLSMVELGKAFAESILSFNILN